MSPADDLSQADELAGVDRARWFGVGAWQALRGPAWAVGISLSSVGSLAYDAGVSVWVAALSTLLIWAGPAQVIYFAAIAAKSSPFAVALAVFVSAIRFLPMVIALMPMMRTQRTRLSTQLLAGHLIAVTVWVESIRRLPAVPKVARLAFFFGFGFACVATTTLGTVAGYKLAGALPRWVASGILFMTPIYFLLALVRNARAPMDWAAIGIAFGLLPFATQVLQPGADLLAVSLAGGAGGYALRWRSRRCDPQA